MKNLVIAAAMTCMVCACGQKPAEPENPFFSEFQSPYGAPDFDRIQLADYEPAFLKGMRVRLGGVHKHHKRLAYLLQLVDYTLLTFLVFFTG